MKEGFQQIINRHQFYRLRWLIDGAIEYASQQENYFRLDSIRKKYKNYSMIPSSVFVDNLVLCQSVADVKGCVVECGVWRGGMSAAMAEILGKDRIYYLFDSFEGLPIAQDIDGVAAQKWQQDTESPNYFDNCRAETHFAEEAMQMSGAKDYRLVQGWFSDTLHDFTPEQPIGVLRLDGDWYDSTMQCLNELYQHVVKGGLVIIDDYYAWDGCTKAVHDFLSANRLPERIRQSNQGVCFLLKES